MREVRESVCERATVWTEQVCGVVMGGDCAKELVNLCEHTCAPDIWRMLLIVAPERPMTTPESSFAIGMAREVWSAEPEGIAEAMEAAEAAALAAVEEEEDDDGAAVVEADGVEEEEAAY